MTTKTSTTTLESRFSFDPEGQGIELGLPGIYEATPAEIVAQMVKVDRAHIRRRSEEMDAPKFRIDGNEAARILMLAVAIEKKTYQHRGKGEHRGALGALCIELLRVLVWFGRKYGQIFPCYHKLAHALRRHPQTIITAMRRLTDQGFVTKHRRSKKITTPQGQRRVQDSNAYEVHMPAANIGAARIPGLLSSSSESKNSAVPVQKQGHQGSQPNLKPDAELWWLPDPYKMPDGTIC